MAISRPAYISCPHCGLRMRTNRHVTFSLLTKQLVADCHNPNCKFSAYVEVSISQQLQPSLNPNPEIKVPLTR